MAGKAPVFSAAVPLSCHPFSTGEGISYGAGPDVKVNWSAELVALVPPLVATVMSIVPGEPAGAMAVMVVGLLTAKLAAGLPDPKSTTDAPKKLVPVIVTNDPSGPVFGLTAETVGGGGTV